MLILFSFFGILSVLILDRTRLEDEGNAERLTFIRNRDLLNIKLNKISAKLEARNKALTRYLDIDTAAVKLNKCISEEELLDMVSNEIYKAIRKGTVYIFYRKDIDFKLIAGRPKSFRYNLDDKAIDFDSGIYSEMMARKTSIKIDDLSKEFKFKEIQAIEGTRSLIAYPILIDDDVAGFIKVDSEKTDRFTYDDIRLVSYLGDLAGLFLTNIFYLNEITKLADSDPLTGLFIRRYFLERLSLMLTDAAKRGGKLSLIFMDIDDFKKLNDKHGHLVGDEILRNLGRYLRHSLRDDDCVGRYGGEEFIIALNNTDIDTGYKIAERLRKGIESMSVVLDKSEFHITVSQGISEFHDNNFSISQLITAADTALYSAKKQGKNKVITFEGKL